MLMDQAFSVTALARSCATGLSLRDEGSSSSVIRTRLWESNHFGSFLDSTTTIATRMELGAASRSAQTAYACHWVTLRGLNTIQQSMLRGWRKLSRPLRLQSGSAKT